MRAVTAVVAPCAWTTPSLPDSARTTNGEPFSRLPPTLEFAPKPGARKNGKDLVLQVVTERAGLPPKSDVEALKARVREDLHAALTHLAVARKLPPPPPLPPPVSMNAPRWRVEADS